MILYRHDTAKKYMSALQQSTEELELELKSRGFSARTIKAYMFHASYYLKSRGLLGSAVSSNQQHRGRCWSASDYKIFSQRTLTECASRGAVGGNALPCTSH